MKLNQHEDLLMTLSETKTTAKDRNAMNEINTNLSFTHEKKGFSGIQRAVDSVLEDHSVRAEIPACAVIRMKKVFSHKFKLLIT